MEPNIDKLYEQYQEIALRIAFAEIRQEEAADIITATENDPELAREADDFYRATHRTTEKKIAHAIARKRLKRTLRITAPIARVVAYVLLFLYVGLSTAIAASPNFRSRFTQFLISIGNKYTTLELCETDPSFPVPNEWQGNYYLSYIPDGYKLFVIEGSDGNSSVTYTDSYDNGITFDECGIDMLTSINTEGMETSYIPINGQNIFTAQKENFLIYTWPWFDRYFILSFSGKIDISEDVLQGILRIR
jgi:hypothetical protein